ncbi:MAG: AAA family ATPase [Clostridium perfringens]|uniref:AAA family ATPase n=1 Tax=Clostridium perfringens TaxID=1502 RepID=UPI0024BCB5D6|nr:AAA family ATPase [Clostridium perfringens]MDU7548678.1 AAA family ATPase [Clostridium perfringens]
MLFRVRKSGTNIEYIRGVAYLIEDQWDDWFKYSTMYTLNIMDDNGELHHIGKVKIGEYSMGCDQRRPNILNEFHRLGEKFFSLGQSDSYYENLNNLGKSTREAVLRALNDIALDETIFENVLKEDVTRTSLLREIPERTVRGQFNRMAKGGARLTRYRFNYTAPDDEKAFNDPIDISFNVVPESNPPSNIHVIIGRNGVGKTRLIKNMIKSLVHKDEDKKFGEFSDSIYWSTNFTNIICVAFSAFDEFASINKNVSEDEENIPFINIGLPLNISQSSNKNEENELNRINLLNSEFVKSADRCINGVKEFLWEKAINTLESDPIFKEANVLSLKDVEKDKFKEKATELFSKLSSGHKIILLTITKLVQNVEEKSLIFLDEPEGHLHPPLLSAFIRALSELLINRNGVAIIATHSPVVLQEVPRNCVWKLRRSGREAIAERLEIESFGENIGVLTRAVFGFEVTNSGFHKILKDAVEKFDDYDEIINHFNGELGMEARGILRALIAIKEENDDLR